MSLYNLFHRLLFGLKDRLDGTGVYATASQLEREQFRSINDIAALQAQRLQMLLEHAQTHSAYYDRILKDIEVSFATADDLKLMTRLPLLTRNALQSHREEILCRNIPGTYADSSGGSTGQPVNFYHDADYLRFARANEMLHMSWMDVQPGDRTAIIWGADRDLKDESRYVRLMLSINRVKRLNSFSLSDERVDSFIRELNRFRPKYIYGYASSLYYVARTINNGHRLHFSPTAIRSSAEMLYDFQREEIEKAFGGPVYNFYGSREVNNVAAECNAHDGLHVFASGRIVEIVDLDGNPMPDGEVGHVAVTDLVNRAFPFIRYLNGDMAAARSDRCSCGRGYPRLEGIVGRSSDMIEINGEHIHGEYFTHLFYGHPEVAQFQFVQEEPTRFSLYLVPGTGELDTSSFRDKLAEKLGPGADLEIIVTDTIEPGPSGKHRFTISKVKR